MARRIGGQRVVIVRRDRDSGGALSPTGVRVVVDGCFVEPKGAGGNNEQQADRRVSSFRLYGPAVLGSVRTVDLLEVDGWLVGVTGRAMLETAGEVDTWPDFRGRVDHVEFDAAYTPPVNFAIVVVRVPRDPRHGDPLGPPTEHTIPDCVVEFGATSEDSSSGQQETATATVYVRNPAADITATDRVRLPSDPVPPSGAGPRVRAPWRVVGDPLPWDGLHGTFESGLRVRVERATG